jgi:DUF1680 family protein
MEANPAVEETRNHVAVMRGPIVYCVESRDLPSAIRVSDVRIPREAKFSARFDKSTLGGVDVIEGKAMASPDGAWDGELYREVKPAPAKEFDLKLVPYFAWGNRGNSEMSIWLPLGG